MDGRILITGSSGHLGQGLLRVGRAAGWDIVGLDRLGGAGGRIAPAFVGSITDSSVVRAALDGVRVVVHTATLHKPHVATHSRSAFVETNITGTLQVLDAAVDAGVEAFVFISTTSTFGASLVPAPGEPAVWIDARVPCVPKNIYGATKTGAEDLVHLVHRTTALSATVLRTSRFFPEADDQARQRAAFESDNLKANELMYRRVDLEDCVSAAICAARWLCAEARPFERFVVSGTTPFSPSDAPELAVDAASVVRRRVPGIEAAYARHGFRLPERITRVYDNTAARERLAWRPRWDVHALVAQLNRIDPEVRRGRCPGIGSDMARLVGPLGYHSAAERAGWAEDGAPYPV